MRFVTVLSAAIIVAIPALPPAAAEALTRSAVNAAEYSESSVQDGPSALLLKTQVLLDRRNFSPGVLDGLAGDNTAKAIRAFQDAAGLGASGQLDEATWRELTRRDEKPILIDYTISEQDVAGPFNSDIPAGLEQQAKLDRLPFRSPRELLAEKFHMDEDLLGQLNPEAAFDKAGVTIVVANVRRPDPDARVAKIVIDKSARTLRALDDDGGLIAFYPATVGSDENPAPSGTYEVTGIAENPTYHYRPSLEFEGVADKKFTVPPGPNNPVGSIWIDLSKEGYGIHGTPEPAEISKTASHGCVRLTNWDAQQLAKMTRAGIKVEFVE